MGMFATIKDLDKCPKCGKKATWQSKGLWLTYKGREFWIGDEGGIELDENMNGHIVAYGIGIPNDDRFCNHITYFKIRKGQLIESNENDYRNE